MTIDIPHSAAPEIFAQSCAFHDIRRIAAGVIHLHPVPTTGANDAATRAAARGL